MCGIIGLIGNDELVAKLLACLSRLNYRGYDSAGVALIRRGAVEIIKRVGNIEVLSSTIEGLDVKEIYAGIGHTRWATHGRVTEANAHPHGDKDLAIVHNGVITNHRELRSELGDAVEWSSDTDSEIIVHLMRKYIGDHGGIDLQSVMSAWKSCLNKLEGSYALAMVLGNHPDRIFMAKSSGPLVVAVDNNGKLMLGSDVVAFGDLISEAIYLQDGDYGWIAADGKMEIFNLKTGDAPIIRPRSPVDVTSSSVSKEGHAHYMLKEIFEQPRAVRETLEELDKSPPDIEWCQVESIVVVACGTSYHAGEMAKYWFEEMAGISTQALVASEFLYSSPVLNPSTLFILVSQSGETADTLGSLRLIKQRADCRTLGIVNVAQSSLAREVDFVIHTKAGPEIGVASTKSLSCQLVVFLYLALQAASSRGVESPLEDLRRLPYYMELYLGCQNKIKQISPSLAQAQNCFFLGRGTSYPLALEGALKLKELAYIHAQGYPMGELKHGPIALINDQVPIVVIAPRDRWFERTMIGVEEISSRGGQITLITTDDSTKNRYSQTLQTVILPDIPQQLIPIAMVIPLQFLAYYAAVDRDNNVDQPRNLAKSVTVE